MKIVNPNDTEHTLYLIPRRYDYDNAILSITSEIDNSVITPTSTIVYDNGFLNVNFEHTFVEGTKYSFKISDDLGIVYRGRIIVSEQGSEENETNVNYITYE